MRFILLIILALLICPTFTSCTPTPMAERIDLSPTEGEDGEVPDDDDEDDDGSNS